MKRSIRKITLQALVATLAIASAPAVLAIDNDWDNLPPTSAGQQSRAAVLADLQLWLRSGADQYAESSAHYGLQEREYKSALDKYKGMRSGPEFLQEMARINQGQSLSHAK
jgi:hypothetical protein